MNLNRATTSGTKYYVVNGVVYTTQTTALGAKDASSTSSGGKGGK